MPAHVGGQEKTGIGLIDGIALRAGEVDKMPAEFQHLRAPRLLSGFVCQMGGGDCGAGGYGVDTNVGIDQPHSHVFGQGVDGPLGRGVGRAAEGPIPVDRGNIDDTALVFGQEDLQRFPDEAEGTKYIGLIYVLQPLIIRLIDHLLLADGGVVDDDIQVAVYVQRGLDDLF